MTMMVGHLLRCPANQPQHPVFLEFKNLYIVFLLLTPPIFCGTIPLSMILCAFPLFRGQAALVSLGAISFALHTLREPPALSQKVERVLYGIPGVCTQEPVEIWPLCLIGDQYTLGLFLYIHFSLNRQKGALCLNCTAQAGSCPIWS